MKFIRSLIFLLAVGLGLAALVFIVLRWVPFGRYPGPAFFDLAAQTIPILLVALAVEAQARQFDSETTSKRIRIAAVVFLACGETTAIAVSASLFIPERGTFALDLLIAVTAVGLLGGFFAVIAVALRTPKAPARPKDTTPRQPKGEVRASAAPASHLSPTATGRRASALSGLAGVIAGTVLLATIRRDG
jgi:hypothetical protein